MSKSKAQSHVKVAIYTISFVIIAVCLALSFWYYWIAIYGPPKTIVNTFNVGQLTMADGSKQQIISVKYNSNKNKNGLEMFDIQLNYFSDETREKFSSQGLQFVANTVNDDLTWISVFDDSTTKYYGQTGNWFTGYKLYYETYGSYTLDSQYATIYNYSSGEDGVFGQSTNPISDDSFFRIQVGDDIYGLELKGTSIGRKELYGATENFDWEHFIAKSAISFLAGSLGPSFNVNEYYYSYDIYYLAKVLYENAVSYSGGMDLVKDVELPDLFNYTKWNGSSYLPVTNEQDIVKIREKVINNYAIHFEISNDGAQIASDSLFNIVHNNPTYRISEDVYDDYAYGKDVFKIDVYDFDLVKVDNNSNYVFLKLSDGFVKKYKQYAKQVNFIVEIDLDELEKYNYKFMGFSLDSGLEDFNVVERYTLKTIDGEVVKSEVRT